MQLLQSEMEGRSVIPVAFWYFSLGGGLITLVYAFHLGKVGLASVRSAAVPVPIYARNLWLIHRERSAAARADSRTGD